MVQFATYNQLSKSTRAVKSSQILKGSLPRVTSRVFLSYSSADRLLLPGVVEIIESAGVQVYVDVGDAQLPSKPSSETADRLRTMLRSSRRFVVFVTENSQNSRWVPWELGLGDGHIGKASVALFPAAEFSTNQDWSRTEYLGLYRRIVYGSIKGYDSPGWMVHDHASNTAEWLGSWLK